MSYPIDVDEEITELRGVIPNVSRSDFYELDNGNIGTIIYYDPTEYQFDTFEVLIEYTPGYPDQPPNAWVLDPEIDSDSPHIWEWDNGDPRICFIKPARWKSSYTSYDAAAMIKSWVWTYCNWMKTGSWDWDEVGFVGHLF